MNKYLKILVGSKLVQAPLNLSKRIVIPGFDGIPLYDVLEFFIKGIMLNSLTTRASSLAFRFFLALFPFIIFLVSIIPYIPVDNFHSELLNLLEQVLPGDSYDMAKETINDLVNKKHNTLLSFGFIFAFYLASNGVNSMITAFNSSYHAVKKGSFIQSYLRSFLLLIILTLLMIIAIGLVIFSEMIIDYLVSHGFLHGGGVIFLLNVVKYIVILALFFLGISSLYYFGNIKNDKFRFVSAGSTLATLLSILLSSGFAYYVNHFASYNKVYGSIGTLIVIMLWLYFNSLVLLIGFELNASIKHAKSTKQIKK
ncbi:MAG: YihY/virulence factor BrkB family protein [Vicingaceae bacterium]|nr:YihY/virulence factor BrkB family protein [Vicingaceae bacterium]